MSTGRKNNVRFKPYGPIAARESDENYDLPLFLSKNLLSSWRMILFLTSLDSRRSHEQGTAARTAFRGPPAN